MTRWGLVIDISKCNACYCCFVACKDEYWENDYPPYTSSQPRHGHFWMNLAKSERGTYPCIKVAYMPVPCMQCQDAPCVKAGKDGAVYKRDDGIVVIDPQKAKGQKQLVDSCPYGAIYYNEESDLPQKCTFCVHRLEDGEVPRCVQACPTGALTFGDLDDSQSEVSRLLKETGAEVYHPEWNTGPSVYYVDLHKVTRHFIAGTAVYGDTDECAEDVTATLSYDGTSATVKTNNYGDFEFDGLEAGRYTVKLEAAGYAAKSIDVDLKATEYLGNIILDKP
jgi:Fe-S-cluster-containing dehydrogenase component